MKKFFSLMLALLMCIIPLASCSSSENYTKFTIIEENFGDELYAIGFRKGDVALMLKVQEILDAMIDAMGVIGDRFGALGILTITPSEGSIIGADVATKAADVQIVFLDRFNGSLVIGGDVASVEAAVKDVLRVLGELMGFAPTAITRT